MENSKYSDVVAEDQRPVGFDTGGSGCERPRGDVPEVSKASSIKLIRVVLSLMFSLDYILQQFMRSLF